MSVLAIAGAASMALGLGSDGVSDSERAFGVAAGESDAVLIAAAPGGGNDPTWIDDVANKIDESGVLDGYTIDVFNLNNGTLSLDDLGDYAAVLTFTDATPQGADAWGDTLADYVDSGGGVVMLTFNFSIGAVGRFFEEGYSPFDVGSQTQGVQQGIGAILIPDHPVLENVNSFNGGTSSYHNTGNYSAGTTQIANWEDGLPFAGEKTFTDSSVIGLNFFPPSTDSREDFWDATTDGGVLMANALLRVAGDGGDDCYPDCNDDGALNILDFVCFQGLFQTGAPEADCNDDGALNILDFVCFQGEFQAGCN